MAVRPILDADNVHAVVTTRWDNGAYKPFTITSIQSYALETNLDEDSDPFNIVIGDRTGEFAEMLHRDNEVRIQIFGIGEGITYLMTGIMDSVIYSDEGVYVCSGRDLSCIATDTLAEPIVYRHQRASDIIIDRARKLKCGVRWPLTPTNVLGKIATDGSETEWEFWYRFIRRAGQYLWFEPDGTLRSGKLNYGVDPTYFFGDPKKGTNPGQWIPVERAEFHSSKQQRVEQAVIFYNNNNRLLKVTEHDKTIQAWLRKPKRFFEQKDIVKSKGAKHFVVEEIKESQVGALEIKLVVPDPGTLIRQNTMARLNIPLLSLEGDWFVCGTRIIADESGFTQEVRLREAGFAISRRVPADPPTSQEPGKSTIDGLADILTIPNHPEWSQFFINAAREFHGNYEFEWFLAVMLGICERETGFTNVRNRGGPGVLGVEWFDWDKTTQGPQHGIRNLAEWQLSFANESPTYAVGPMQLYSQGYKDFADKNPNDGPSSELRGNRWLPENNIWGGGYALNSKAHGLPSDPASIWQAVAAYGEGPAYANGVRASVEGEGGWYEFVKESFLAAREAAKNNVGAVEAIDGSVKELAEIILNYYAQGKYRDDNGAQLGQLKAMKDGKRIQSPCKQFGDIQIDAKVLGVIKLLLDNGYWVGTFALASDHDCLTDDGGISRHSSGFAVDISSLGEAGTGWTTLKIGGKACERLTISAMNLLRGQKRGVYLPKQLICEGVGMHVISYIKTLQMSNYESTDHVTGDHLNHIHVGY